MAGSLNKDGKKYAERSKGSIISYLLDENSNNYRRQLESKGIKPKNHHKENLKHIEEIQKLTKQQQENEMKRANMKNKKCAKYLKINSKLKQTVLSKSNTSSFSLSHNKNNKNTNFILKNMSKIQSQSTLNASMIKKNRINTQRKPAIPKRSKLNISKHKNVEERDFVSLNKKFDGQQIENKRNGNNQIRFVNKKDYGKVPQYIINRKLEMEQLEQKKMEEEELRKIPNGMRKMEDNERLETLEILKMNKMKIIESIKNLPLVIETPSMIKYQSQLNQKLNQIEKTISLFQKPTVFVAINQ